MALFYNGEYVEGKKSPKKQIEEWLLDKYPNNDLFTDRGRKRIITMINPKKGGGAPKSSEINNEN